MLPINITQANNGAKKRIVYFESILKILAIAAVLLFFTQCTDTGKPGEHEGRKPANDDNTVDFTDAQYKNAGIETTQLTRRNIASILRLNGKIDVPPQNLISVSVPLGGYLLSTKLLPGMHIRKGEVIAIMEDQQYVQLQQDYLQAKSKLHFAELNYNRQKELNQSQAASDKATQLAQAEMENQHILTNALAEKLKLININPNNLSAGKISKSIPIYSSITGFVSKVNVNIGKYVTPSDVLFELINPSDIHLNLKVYEKDVVKLSIGQKVIAFSNAEPDKKLEGDIILISKDISPDGITEVHCHFDKYHPKLLPGTYMNAEVETLSSSVNTLPEESIVNFEGKNYVFTQTAKQSYTQQEVNTGMKENGFVEIRNSDALQGKTIVSKGAYTLLMKLKNKEE